MFRNNIEYRKVVADIEHRCFRWIYPAIENALSLAIDDIGITQKCRTIRANIGKES
jgi:hypothetical protein